MNDTAHVVSKSGVGAIGYAFYESGEACGVKTSGITALMVSIEDGELHINLSDPSQTQKSLILDIDMEEVLSLIGIEAKNYEVVSVSERTEATLEGDKLTIVADTFEEASEGHTVKIKL